MKIRRRLRRTVEDQQEEDSWRSEGEGGGGQVKISKRKLRRTGEV